MINQVPAEIIRWTVQLLKDDVGILQFRQTSKAHQSIVDDVLRESFEEDLRYLLSHLVIQRRTAGERCRMKDIIRKTFMYDFSPPYLFVCSKCGKCAKGILTCTCCVDTSRRRKMKDRLMSNVYFLNFGTGLARATNHLSFFSSSVVAQAIEVSYIFNVIKSLFSRLWSQARSYSFKFST